VAAGEYFVLVRNQFAGDLNFSASLEIVDPTPLEVGSVVNVTVGPNR
jgi:hypothetical protein